MSQRATYAAAGGYSLSCSRRTRVLIIDPSALARHSLTEILRKDASIEVVGGASSPFIARQKFARLRPDVLVSGMDLQHSDAFTFLRNLVHERPTPIVMVPFGSSAQPSCIRQARALGALDFLHLDAGNSGKAARRDEEAVRAAIRQAANRAVPLGAVNFPKSRVVAIGASTGGTEALKDVLGAMPTDCPGILVAQHIPKRFSASFARRLDAVCAIAVCEAEDGQEILPGHAYIAPGDRHLRMERADAGYVCRLDNGPRVNRHIPSVDVLFHSVAQEASADGIGVLLTGMGKDGAAGLKEMRGVNCPTIAQDERTSVVWGMPGEAVAMGAACEVLPLDAIAGRILAFARGVASRGAARSDTR